MKQIVLGGGCFWCTEAVMQELVGVVSVVPGYAGGTKPHPTYEQVMTGKTGHVEVVKVDYDEIQIDLDAILNVFFLSHDPTSMDRQGADVGSEYRSVIYYSDANDKALIDEVIHKNQNNIGRTIVTEVKELDTFYEAEPYHHNYFRNNPDAGYCQIVIAPKLYKVQSLTR